MLKKRTEKDWQKETIKILSCFTREFEAKMIENGHTLFRKRNIFYGNNIIEYIYDNLIDITNDVQKIVLSIYENEIIKESNLKLQKAINGNKIKIVPAKNLEVNNFAKEAMKYHSLTYMNVDNFHSGFIVGFYDCISSITIEENKLKFDLSKIKKQLL